MEKDEYEGSRFGDGCPYTGNMKRFHVGCLGYGNVTPCRPVHSMHRIEQCDLVHHAGRRLSCTSPSAARDLAMAAIQR
ncbi:hypothetical protein NDU88_006542 [Pleurodeles waltl]|uniref:Uncharacterized protein n=1 Tax=Pleurodeles waltl TaxID=8319 RepID=A0AAV7NQH7_PLEWA|nr:hypothetical protein NDU88_006542 [Pleurodeles waltl]